MRGTVHVKELDIGYYPGHGPRRGDLPAAVSFGCDTSDHQSICCGIQSTSHKFSTGLHAKTAMANYPLAVSFHFGPDCWRQMGGLFNSTMDRYSCCNWPFFKKEIPALWEVVSANGTSWDLRLFTQALLLMNVTLKWD